MAHGFHGVTTRSASGHGDGCMVLGSMASDTPINTGFNEEPQTLGGLLFDFIISRTMMASIVPLLNTAGKGEGTYISSDCMGKGIDSSLWLASTDVLPTYTESNGKSFDKLTVRSASCFYLVHL